MPSKIQLDETLWFLFICLQKSDYKVIDFNAVAATTNLNPPAARMRYTRLRKQIESGTLIGTHGMPFQGGADKIADSMKRPGKVIHSEDDRKPSQEPSALVSTSNKIKAEESTSEDCETDSSSYEDFDSDDDVPLAKRRALGPKQLPKPLDNGTSDFMTSDTTFLDEEPPSNQATADATTLSIKMPSTSSEVGSLHYANNSVFRCAPDAGHMTTMELTHEIANGSARMLSALLTEEYPVATTLPRPQFDDSFKE